MLGEGEAGLAKVTIFGMNCIRTLSKSDKNLIMDLVHCHKMVFPNSLLNILGDRYLMRSFYWSMLNYEKRNILVYEQDGKIIGFLIMRCSDDIDNFLKYIYKTIIWCFISKPALFLNFSLMKKILNHSKQNNSWHPHKTYLELVSIGVSPSFLNMAPNLLIWWIK